MTMMMCEKTSFSPGFWTYLHTTTFLLSSGGGGGTSHATFESVGAGRVSVADGPGKTKPSAAVKVMLPSLLTTNV